MSITFHQTHHNACMTVVIFFLHYIYINVFLNPITSYDVRKTSSNTNNVELHYENQKNLTNCFFILKRIYKHKPQKILCPPSPCITMCICNNENNFILMLAFSF